MILVANFVAVRYLVVVCMFFAIVGCKRENPGTADNSDLQRWVAQTREQSSVALEPTPQIQQFELFQYKSDAMPDPFSATQNGRETRKSRPASKGKNPTLEQYPLERLKMVGTIGTGPLRVGVVMTPDLAAHRVLQGAYLGDHEGRVTGIHEDRIELVERVSDGAGGWSERPAALTLGQ